MKRPAPQRRPRLATPSVYEAVTDGVTVRVSPAYMPEQSNREGGRFVWSYTVEIENRGARELQLISRHWIITDGLGRTEEVKGSGVVGEQPSLKPGEAFRYASACPLGTTSGLMRGSYQMLTEEGQMVDVEIPLFSLDVPGASRRLH